MSQTRHPNREAWLSALVELLRPRYKVAGYPIPERLRMAIGFTSSKTAIGQCWYEDASADRHTEIFIRPDHLDAVAIASTLTHELVHAALGPGHGHGRLFRAAAKAVGLDMSVPMPKAGPGPDLTFDLMAMIEELGPLPHAYLNTKGALKEGPKPQKGRNIKVECPVPGCGYKVRITREHLDRGAPFCGIEGHGRMVEDAGAAPAEDELEVELVAAA